MHIVLIAAALAWSWTLSMGAGAAAAAPPTDSVTILHTNDVHAHLLPDDKGRGGWASICALIKQRKEKHANVLVLDGGDMTQGTPVSSVFHGTPIFHVMNACGYDYAVLGNHEFDNGTRYIREFREIAEFPLLSANVVGDGGAIADAPTALVDVDGVRVGIIGLTTSAAIHQEDVSILTPEDVVARYVPELDREADLIVALTHLGFERDQELAAATQGIDVVIGGHSNTELEQPVQVGDTWVAQAGNFGLYLGELHVTINTETEELVSVEGGLIPISRAAVPPDPESQTVIEEWEAKVADRMNEKIGHNPREQDVEELKAHIEAVWKAAFQTDFAFQNPGGTRDYLPAGDILVRHIWSAMPFDNTLATVQLSAEEVRAIIPDAELSDEKPLYSVLTNSYVGERLVKDYGLPRERLEPITLSWRDPIIDYVRKHGHLSPD